MEYQGPGSPGFPGGGHRGDRTPARGFPPGGGHDPWSTPEPAPAETEPGPDGYADYDYPDGADGADGADTTTLAAVPSVPRRRGRNRSGIRSHPVLIAVATVLILAAGALTGYKFLYQRANAPVTGSVRLPTYAPGSSGSPGFNSALGKWQYIGTRAQDPTPLTVSALFPPQFALSGSSYTRTAASTTKTCSSVVYGSQLTSALQSGHCDQVLRASYVSGDGQMMGTIGVANLTSATAAQKAGQASGPQEIIAPLSARSGVTKKLGNGTGIVQAVAKGHYLILMWAEFTNLKSPSTQAARQQLEQFAQDLFIGTANINLSTRMLGRPS
jgi:hypothetical protein